MDDAKITIEIITAEGERFTRTFNAENFQYEEKRDPVEKPGHPGELMPGPFHFIELTAKVRVNGKV
jgi:hypothetical protein